MNLKKNTALKPYFNATAKKRKPSAVKDPILRPTKERMRKPDYEKKGAHGRKRAQTLLEMERRGIIGGAALEAAERWISDYIFALEGYGDFLFEKKSDETLNEEKKYGAGDRHTFEIAKGKAWRRIVNIRAALGLCAHRRLKLLLADQLSFTVLGQIFHPELSEGRARDRASAQCALILEQLAEHYFPKKPAQHNTPKGKGTDIRSFGSFEGIKSPVQEYNKKNQS